MQQAAWDCTALGYKGDPMKIRPLPNKLDVELAAKKRGGCPDPPALPSRQTAVHIMTASTVSPGGRLRDRDCPLAADRRPCDCGAGHRSSRGRSPDSNIDDCRPGFVNTGRRSNPDR